MAPKAAPKRKRGRPRGAPTTSKLLDLDLRHVQYFNALIETSTRGKPAFVSLVRQAMDFYLKAELAKPGIRAEVEEYLGKNRRAGLKIVRGDKN
jgi:hypothetical protein